ncbi:unnamed protein product [Moneuplotes crassus]|uniref:Protein phosphatase n=1 Tax=Euplotes crassus TaxID=5936 RepID=A0AAD2DAJ9_EUPCR|nr:unnamed protein product [Moneuplotes crassus]
MISKRRGKPSEDALFTTPNYLGIADGVGGWVEYGVDSSKFSNELMKNCKNEVIKFNQEIEQSANYESEESDYDLFGSNNSKCSQNYDANSLESGSVSHEATEIKPKNVLNPTTVLSKAYRKVRSIGSSTACVCALNTTSGEMEVSNIGDSGFLVIRKNIIYQSEEQQHSFNAPYQLTRMPLGFARKHKIFGYYSDKPKDSKNYTCRLQKGDIVILATDGLFDNLYSKDIIRIVNKFLLRQKQTIYTSNGCHAADLNNIVELLDSTDAYNLARTLSLKAWKNSLSSSYISPFGSKMNSLLKTTSTKLIPELEEWRGGKKDDVSVIVSFVN